MKTNTPSLPPRRQDTLDFITSYINEQHRSPSLTDIAHNLGVTVPAVKYHLSRLVKEQLIRYTPNQHRSIEVVGMDVRTVTLKLECPDYIRRLCVHTRNTTTDMLHYTDMFVTADKLLHKVSPNSWYWRDTFWSCIISREATFAEVAQLAFALAIDMNENFLYDISAYKASEDAASAFSISANMCAQLSEQLWDLLNPTHG